MTAQQRAKFEGTIQPWGNSLGVRITRPMSDIARLGRGDEVEIEVTEEGILIRRKTKTQHVKLPYAEADLLEGMTPHKAHADELPVLSPNEIGD